MTTAGVWEAMVGGLFSQSAAAMSSVVVVEVGEWLLGGLSGAVYSYTHGKSKDGVE